MEAEKINSIFEGFNSQKALVIGDVMVDAYYWGKVSRISPEAPVPVVSVTKKEHRLGGAANVALNIQALGATPILCAIIGEDEKGQVFQQLMEEAGLDTSCMVQSEERPTTTKTRIISSHQQVVRVDEETEDKLSNSETERLLASIKKALDEQQPDVVVFEDYNKGLLTKEIISQVIDWAKEKDIPTAVDPKKENFFSYAGTSLFKPNLKEIREGLKTDKKLNITQEIEQAVDQLKQQMPCETVMVTLSEKGVYIANGKEAHSIPAHIRNIADVSGAGDTVISVAALCLAQNLPIETIAELANLAGGLVCEKVGVVPINKQELQQEAQRLSQS